MSTTRGNTGLLTTQAWRPETDVNPRNTTLRRALTELRKAGVKGKVLEVGCGAGRFISYVAREIPDAQGHGCDLSYDDVLLAAMLSPQVKYAAADMTRLPYAKDAFDAVVMFDILEHLTKPEDGLAEVRRVLKPSGIIHALVPCEGQVATLHWLMWKLGLGSDLKEKRVGHVQRFTHKSLSRLLADHGFLMTSASYSMHPVGQIKDILMYLEQEHPRVGWLWRNPAYRLIYSGLWAYSYVESMVLSEVPLSAVSVHVSAMKI
ncbi:MAG: class I SAM-dependent methyltransferase [Dehalococcoidia bacterium]|nr:class I SAM-dependent methyltransferase [Dehalococcoidia bacterium]